jgi:hypothetical protein
MLYGASSMCGYIGITRKVYYVIHKSEGKGKAVPLQAWTGPCGSRRLRLPDFKTFCI